MDFTAHELAEIKNNDIGYGIADKIPFTLALYQICFVENPELFGDIGLTQTGEFHEFPDGFPPSLKDV